MLKDWDKEFPRLLTTKIDSGSKSQKKVKKQQLLLVDTSKAIQDIVNNSNQQELFVNLMLEMAKLHQKIGTYNYCTVINFIDALNESMLQLTKNLPVVDEEDDFDVDLAKKIDKEIAQEVASLKNDKATDETSCSDLARSINAKIFYTASMLIVLIFTTT